MSPLQTVRFGQGVFELVLKNKRFAKIRFLDCLTRRAGKGMTILGRTDAQRRARNDIKSADAKIRFLDARTHSAVRGMTMLGRAAQAKE